MALEAGGVEGATSESRGSEVPGSEVPELSASLRESAIAALWSLLPEPEEAPAPAPSSGTALAESYRRHLAAGGSS